uniref:Uncharacterized protein n=1 Tax=Nelumbo nucifera TaxID=4432 RepID=A0A822YB87_NELNU|nr:TPA_asm: hypothetical protein HUJ06_029753 [Nelumbo nucifera]
MLHQQISDDCRGRYHRPVPPPPPPPPLSLYLYCI